MVTDFGSADFEANVQEYVILVLVHNLLNVDVGCKASQVSITESIGVAAKLLRVDRVQQYVFIPAEVFAQLFCQLQCVSEIFCQSIKVAKLNV